MFWNDQCVFRVHILIDIDGVLYQQYSNTEGAFLIWDHACCLSTLMDSNNQEGKGESVNSYIPGQTPVED